MNRLALFVFCILCTLTQVAYANGGGEDDHTHCNGVGNPNSYCDGSEDPEPEVCEDPTPQFVPPPSCTVPTQAVNTYLTTSNFYFSSDPKTHDRQCKIVGKTCASVAKAQGKCFAARIKGARSFSLSNCAFVAPAYRKYCTAQVKTNSGANLRIFKAATLKAVNVCTAWVEECVQE